MKYYMLYTTNSWLDKFFAI